MPKTMLQCYNIPCWVQDTYLSHVLLLLLLLRQFN